MNEVVEASGMPAILLALVIALGGALIIIGLAVFVSRRFQREPPTEELPVEFSDQEIPWETLFERADKALKKLIAELPEEIRCEAQRVPWLLEKWPPDSLAPDTLGVYHGFESHTVSNQGGPIFIFVGCIFDYCEQERLSFEKEVRKTYLHELGHHLGLEEDELESRGLL
ncbi:MAG: metallopeptidase family protein [Verrucomicrobiota bacterium]